MESENKTISLKEFAEKHNCNYVGASRRLQKRFNSDPEMKNHVFRSGARYHLDEYAEAALIPQKRFILKTNNQQQGEIKMETENKAITLKEFAEKHNCNYEGTSRRLKMLLELDPEMKNHVFRKGAKYQLDEYAEAALIPQKRYAKRKESSSTGRRKMERLNEEREYLLEKQKAISEEIRRKENELNFKRMEIIHNIVYKCLGRTYQNNDEIRLEEFLKNCKDFKTFMNSEN